MKIKKLKIKLNKNNEYSDYRYFIPKSNNIKMTDGRDVDEAVQSLKDKIANLKEQANYLINKAPLVKYAEGTSITITDCAEAPLRKFSIEGNSYQETREGYNKLKNSAVTQTTNGLSFTVNKDGTVIANGTATDTAILYLNGSTEYVYGAGTYILSGCPEGGKSDTYRLDLMIHSNGNIQAIDTGDGIEFQLSEETILVPRIRIQSGFTVKNLLFKPMIVEGTEAKPFEQYGASPSIDSEAPIESVGDNINLWKMPESQTKNGVTLKVYDDGTYDLFGKATANTEFIVIGDLLDFKKGDYYTFSTNHTGVRYQLALYNGNTWVATPINRTAEETTLEKTINPSTSAEYTVVRLLMTISSGATLNISKGYLKLEKGNKKSAYSPYGQGSIEIYNCNKNLFNKNTIRERHRIGSDGADYSDINYFVSDYIAIKENIKCVKNTPIGIYYAVSYYDKDKKHIVRNTTENPFVTPEGTCYMRVCDLLTNLDTLQLEKGETATDYVEHQSQTKALYTQQPFRAIGDVKDRFVKKDGVWYEEHNIKRIIFTGTEKWRKVTTTSSIEVYAYDLNKSMYATALSIKSNMLKQVDDMWNIAERDDVIKIGGNLNNISILMKDTTTLDDFKAKLVELYNAGTPLYADYPIVTPTLIECTPEQVEVLDSLQSYDRITYYNVDKINNVQANMKLIYKQDINAILEEKGV